MTIPFNIEGQSEGGPIALADVISRRGRSGVRVFTESAVEVITLTRPFFNTAVGINMAQNVAFSGNATIIHAGVNSGAALTGTTDGTTASHLIDSGETFTGIQSGMSVKNTTSGTEYALVTNVASNDLTLDADIFVSGENYEINPIWVGSAISGIWNFADAGKVTITTANDNDEALFDNDTNQQWDVTNFTALTLKVDLDAYDPLNNDIALKFMLNGVQVGDIMLLNDFMDTGDFDEQSVVINIDEFNFATMFVNEMSICMIRTAGTKPTVKFDDIQFEASGEPIVFELAPAGDEVLSIDEIVVSMADALSSIVTVAGATETFTADVLSFDKLLGVSKLTNGILFQRIQEDTVRTSLSFQQISDFLIAGGSIDNLMSDATNTFLTITVPFGTPISLVGGTGDKLTFTISDNLSGLLFMNVFGRGSVEI